MTAEPMTDEDPNMIDLRRFLAEHVGRQGSFRLDVAEGAALIARLDAERARADAAEAERDQHATAYIELHGQHVAKMIELADARSALKRAEAERDAAVARAMPEPRLMRTVEEVEALPEGHYFFNIPDRTFWTAVEKYCDDTWWMLGNECRVKPANLADSFYCIGPLLLPDLPTPTATQEG